MQFMGRGEATLWQIALAQRSDRGRAIECFVKTPEDAAFIL
jgi:hypothetical protein